jgi:hypothetical protein
MADAMATASQRPAQPADSYSRTSRWDGPATCIPGVVREFSCVAVAQSAASEDSSAPALVHSPGCAVVLVHIHLDAVKTAKEETVLADQSAGLRAETLSSQSGLSNTNEHGGHQSAGDVEVTAEANQASGAQLDHRELGAVGLYPGVLLLGLLAHLNGMRLPRSA